MASINKVILIGNLGQDPELKYMPSGGAVCNFTIATTESWKDRDGNPQDKTEWHRIVAFGKLAEICAEYLKKGRQVYIEGKLQTRTWDDKEGVKRYITEIVANDMKMLGKREENNVPYSGTDKEPKQPKPSAEEEDDLPF